MNNSDEENLVGFIAGAVETIREEVATISDEMATKRQLETSTTAIRGDIEQVYLRKSS